MSAQVLETTLAKLYTDPVYLNHFLENPELALSKEDLSEEERVSLFEIDKAGLVMAAASFAHKRRKRFSPPPLAPHWRRFCTLLRQFHWHVRR